MSAILLATINAKWIHPSLALRLLKANLGALEDKCEIIEFALRQPLKEKTEPILAARPRLLGLSVSIWNHLATLELLKELKKEWEKIPGRDEGPAAWPYATKLPPHFATKFPPQKPLVVLGGPEVSWLPEDAEIFRCADYVIRGEGEESFRSLCYEVFEDLRPCDRNFQNGFTNAANVSGSPVFINRGDAVADVDRILPAYNLYTDEDLRRKFIYVEASRGCPFSCEFCHGSVQSAGVREFPLEPFLAELKTLIDRGGRRFKFLDRTFNINMERAQRIMKFFLEQIEVLGGGLSDFVHFEMVPSRLAPEMKELLRRFPPGSLRLEVGIQTLNRESAALIHRTGNPEEIFETLGFLSRETSAIIHADLIAGLPGEDLVSFGAGFDCLWKVLSGAGESEPAICISMGSSKIEVSGVRQKSRFEIQLGILKCLPGTPIARHNETHKMRYSPEPPYEVMETGVLSAADLARIKNFARFWELIVNRSSNFVADSFPDLIPRLFPPEQLVFDRFMTLSDKLLEHFGRNWGIDRKELRSFLALYKQSHLNTEEKD